MLNSCAVLPCKHLLALKITNTQFVCFPLPHSSPAINIAPLVGARGGWGPVPEAPFEAGALTNPSQPHPVVTISSVLVYLLDNNFATFMQSETKPNQTNRAVTHIAQLADVAV